MYVDYTDEEYAGFEETLCGETALELRAAKGDPIQLKRLLCRYYLGGLSFFSMSAH